MKNNFLLALLFLLFGSMVGQSNKYWQQKVNYKMNVVVDAKNYKYTGKQELVYTNNSQDTLKKVFYHLYYNAFQPGSEMDKRLQTIADPDQRMVTKQKESRIKSLKTNEIGYLKIANFKQDGSFAKINTVGTILEVTLLKPIFPGRSTTFTLDFEGQIPVIIRRSGRNNSEGVALSMAQWYPKIAEFDFEGWHADPYIAREFHGVWGDYDVKITIDKDYLLGGTGYLQNKNEIGHGYHDRGYSVNYPKGIQNLTWHFKAPMVHDFTWAADKNYLHDIFKGPNNVALHFIYKNDPAITENWKNLQPVIAKVMDIYNKKVGKYPYEQYSFIQGGDGGMEYPMCTLMLGTGKFDGLVGLAAHELGHSWFQHVLASNESKYPWMDEGFTSYIEDCAINEITQNSNQFPFEAAYQTYLSLVQSGKEQPQCTHADRYDENKSYSISSYYKGEIFLTQLEYLIGKDNFDKTLKKYFNDFKFKHPTPNDIKRTAERVSGAQLDWYLTDWTLTTNTIDYAIKEVEAVAAETTIKLKRIGNMPMPIDILVEYEDGTKEGFYIPLRMMHFVKDAQDSNIKRTVLADWTWADPNYEFRILKDKSLIKKIVIDPSKLMADVKPADNLFEQKL